MILRRTPMHDLLNVLLILLLSTTNFIDAGAQQKSVLIEDVKTLTLHKGQKTQARRTSPIPQLKCTGGSARCAFEPDTVQCYNQGSDGVDIQWECKAEMPTKYKFGRLSVSCEGYGYPDDPYILAGSCGLEYHLDATEKDFHGSQKSSNQYIRQTADSKPYSFLFKVAVIGLILFAFRAYMSSGRTVGGQRPMSSGPGTGGGGGGGGGFFGGMFPGGGSGGNGGWMGGLGGLGNQFGNFFRGQGNHGQPPPPGFRSDYTDYGSGANCNTNRQGGSSGGGFWTGATLGAVGGYLFGNRNRAREPYASRSFYSSDMGSDTGSFFSSSRQRSTQSPSSSSSTHTSSGYSGTTRR
ncbi:unnamed protein product [Didymodactylos carnosus]|uniref:Store-operated calcium entry-associated regulatory factor n=1 Tax=Didymodactylos carnosus TaxID=1234261 RepID=A0A813S4X1_9BILA|nr:unnamed protein product [Didymodactylos carnosus]CAF0794965.1 unnamed protein product [Didymodactylos carnosus]CAF3516152.1 unnamed protein product [Didymodactylos carnosus]CAF3579449.1 unnamed protein product [Didymodactylos carnosus]